MIFSQFFNNVTGAWCSLNDLAAYFELSISMPIDLLYDFAMEIFLEMWVVYVIERGTSQLIIVDLAMGLIYFGLC